MKIYGTGTLIWAILPNLLAFNKLTMPWLEKLLWPTPHHGFGPNPTASWKNAAESWSLQGLVTLTQDPPTPRQLDFGALLTVVELQFGLKCRKDPATCPSHLRSLVSVCTKHPMRDELPLI
jgi:hypothetical protein